MQLLKIEARKKNMNRNGILISNKTVRDARSSHSLLNFNMELIYNVFQKHPSSKPCMMVSISNAAIENKNEPLKAISVTVGFKN